MSSLQQKARREGRASHRIVRCERLLLSAATTFATLQCRRMQPGRASIVSERTTWAEVDRFHASTAAWSTEPDGGPPVVFHVGNRRSSSPCAKRTHLSVLSNRTVAVFDAALCSLFRILVLLAIWCLGDTALIGRLIPSVEQLPVPFVVDVLSSADAGRITAPFRLAAPRVRKTNIVDVFIVRPSWS